MRIDVFKFQVACFGFGAPTSNSRRFGMEHRSEIASFCFGSDFFENEGSQNVFFGSQNSATSKTPGNFRIQNVPELPKTPGELPKHTRNFPNTPGTFQKHPEVPINTRNFPERPGKFRTPGELSKNTRVGGGWWLGGWVRTTPEEGPTGVSRTATWHI
jgi:hypothetical protein